MDKQEIEKFFKSKIDWKFYYYILDRFSEFEDLDSSLKLQLSILVSYCDTYQIEIFNNISNYSKSAYINQDEKYIHSYKMSLYHNKKIPKKYLNIISHRIRIVNNFHNNLIFFGKL